MPIPRKQGRTVAKSSGLQCKTLDLGLEGFSECPQMGPSACKHAVPFGYGFLCRHPVRGTRDAEAQTKKLAASVTMDQGRA